MPLISVRNVDNWNWIFQGNQNSVYLQKKDKLPEILQFSGFIIFLW